MKVTDESIATIPRIESDILNYRYWNTLQQKHRELLEFIRYDEPGTEAVAYYSLDMRELAKYKGPSGAESVPSRIVPELHYIMHTHPYGGTFSLTDVAKFLGSENTLGISAVGNDGSLFTLEKLQSYDVSAVGRYYNDVKHKKPNSETDPDGAVRFMEEFCEYMNGHGFIYRRRCNPDG